MNNLAAIRISKASPANPIAVGILPPVRSLLAVRLDLILSTLAITSLLSALLLAAV